MNNLPSIGVLIACYKHAKFLPQLLESVINQNYLGNIYIVISDDASNDGSKEIIEEFAKRIRFAGLHNRRIYSCIQPKNLGGDGRGNYKNLFETIPDLINPDFITMIDGDDWLYTDRFAKQIEYIQQNNLDACHSDTDHYFEDGSLRTKNFWAANGCYIFNPMTFESQCQNNRIFTNTLIAKTELFKKAADFDLFTKLKCFLGDYCLSSRLSKIAKIGYVDESLSAYRWRQDSESHKDHSLTVADTTHVQNLLRDGGLLEGLD